VRQAQAALGRSLELESGNLRAHLLLAEIYIRERDPERARREAESALKIEPQNYQARMLLGNIDLGQKKYAEAQAAFEALIKAEPDNPAGYFRLGTLQQTRKQYEQALSNFDKALAINPNLLDVFSAVVQVYAEQKKSDAALARCHQQLAQVESNAAAAAVVHNLMGGLYLSKNDAAAAENAFRDAIQKSPNLLSPYYALAGIYLRAHKADKAIEQFTQLLAANPKQAGAHMMIAVIYDSQKKPELSEKHYRACLEIDPKFAPAANNLAYLLAESNRELNEALKHAQTAKGILPEEPSVMDTLGWVYYKKGLYDSAIAEFKASLAKAPENPTVVFHLGLAYHQKGEPEKARAELQRALVLNGNFDGADQARALLAEIK
jgi:tetratricopeptide (TPR) repeat protein